MYHDLQIILAAECKLSIGTEVPSLESDGFPFQQVLLLKNGFIGMARAKIAIETLLIFFLTTCMTRMQ
jgi:hypothetical protein